MNALGLHHVQGLAIADTSLEAYLHPVTGSLHPVTGSLHPTSTRSRSTSRSRHPIAPPLTGVVSNLPAGALVD
ncbi:hypothetical protein [Agromyces sp. PvR057]|uniref:hypothetical protein n=1 Tax=Agromyces sp. PvR057 TaxID=3156403 RepID=UPI000E24049E